MLSLKKGKDQEESWGEGREGGGGGVWSGGIGGDEWLLAKVILLVIYNLRKFFGAISLMI